MFHAQYFRSPVGILDAFSQKEDLLCVLTFAQEEPTQLNNRTHFEQVNTPLFLQLKDWLDIFFSGKNPDFTPPLDLSLGNAFQQQVWKILLQIPYGEVRTYGEIAAQVSAQNGGRPMAAQAIGGAVSRNPIALIVPCHRVVGAHQGMGGYRGGLRNKMTLLELEGHRAGEFRIPASKGR